MEQSRPSLRLPSSIPRATTSPMRITTVHSVHLPFFLKISYQPGHYNVPGWVLSTVFMFKFIVNLGKIPRSAKYLLFLAQPFPILKSNYTFTSEAVSVKLKSPTINASARIFSIYCRTFILLFLFEIYHNIIL